MALPFLFADNARSTLGAALSVGGTTITLASGGGALFPNPAPGQQFALTLNDAATQVLFETVWCTARAGDVLTVIRAQEGTNALAWGVGDFCWNGPTAGQMNNMVQTPHMLDASIAPVFSNTQVQGTLSATGAATFSTTGQFGSTVTATDPSTGTLAGAIIKSTGSGTQGARIELQGSAGTSGAPNKWLRALNGVFDIVNSNYTAQILSLSDLGDLGAIRNITASGSGSFAGPVSSAGIGSFVDAGTQRGVFVTGTGGSGANIQLQTASGNKFIRQLNNRLEVINAAYSNVLLSIDDAGNVTGPGGANFSGSIGSGVNVSATGSVTGASVASSNGNVTAFNGRLRATFGARGSGDPNAATLLADFPSSLGTTGYQFLPNGLIIQWGTQVLNGSWSVLNNFPIAFPNACLTVVCTEGAAGGSWLSDNSGPTIHAASGFNTTGWFHAATHWNVITHVFAVENLTTAWMAIGF